MFKNASFVSATQETIAYSKLHNIYTSCQSSASFGSRSSLKKKSNCTFKQIDNFLRKSENYTKFKQARRNFTRLKVQSYRLNEIWSIDLADMQQLSEFHQGITFLFVAVDTLSRFVWVGPLKRKTAAACRQSLIDVIEGNERGPPVLQRRFCGGSRPVSPNREKIWVDKGREFAREFANFCQQSGIHLYSTCSETKSVFAERNIGSIKAIILKYVHENNTEVYHEQIQAFVDITISRINRVTKLMPNQVKKSDESFLVSLQNCKDIKKQEFKLVQHVRIRLKLNLFFRGYRIQFNKLSWPGLIENVTEGLFSYQLNRDEQNRDTTTQETIVERPRFGNGMTSMYVPTNLLKLNSSTLEEKFSPEKYFSIEKGCYSSVNSILQSMCDNFCSIVGWDISQMPLSWDICEASQLQHLKRLQTKKTKKIDSKPFPKIWKT